MVLFVLQSRRISMKLGEHWWTPPLNPIFIFILSFLDAEKENIENQVVEDETEGPGEDLGQLDKLAHLEVMIISFVSRLCVCGRVCDLCDWWLLFGFNNALLLLILKVILRVN